MDKKKTEILDRAPAIAAHPSADKQERCRLRLCCRDEARTLYRLASPVRGSCEPPVAAEVPDDVAKDAAARVSKYLSERAKMHKLHQEEIASLHIGDEREAILTASDLQVLIAAAPTTKKG